MDCIVTAGPTYEPLDQARRITNFSSGRLGCELANFLSDHGHNVHLLLGEQAVWSGPIRAAEVSRFSTGADLASRLRSLSGPVGAVFHAAAVSDFAFGQAWRRQPDGTLQPANEGKFSTGAGSLVVELVPTPKIIAQLRAWFPSAWITGWKYEVDGSRERVLELARTQMVKHRTDACVANGPGYGAGFGLVQRDGTVEEAGTREALFGFLLKLSQRRAPAD